MRKQRLTVLLAILLLTAAVFLIFFLKLFNAAADEQKTVTVILKSANVSSDFWQAVSNGAQAAAKELGLELDIQGPLQETDAGTQLRILEEAIARKPQAIVVAPINDDRMPGMLDAIRKAGIRLVVMDTPLQFDPPPVVVSSHHSEAGRLAGITAASETKTQPLIAVMSNFADSAISKERKKGVELALKPYKDSLLGMYYSMGSEERAYEIAKSLLIVHPAFNAFVTLDEPSTLGTARALKELKKNDDVKLIGFDSSVDEIELLEEGIVNALVVQKPFNLGYIGVKNALNQIEGSHVDSTTYIDSTVVTRENMNLPENQKLLFPFIDASKKERALIRFLASEYSTETKPLLEKLVKEFELNNPLIDIELQVANWDILDGIYTTMISKNQPPDLLNTNVYAHFAQDGLLNDFDEILSADLKKKLYPNIMQMDRMEGSQYAIPYVATVRNLYYNEDLFRQAHISRPPGTWSELKEAAKKIKSSGAARGFGVDLTDNETQASLSYVFFGAGGGWTKNGSWAINSPENIEGLTFLKTLFNEGLTDIEPTVTTRDEKQRVLGDGKLGMMISGNYFTSVVPKEFPGLKWGAGPIPVKDGVAPVPFAVHDVLVSFKTDHTNKEALSKFLDFLYDDANYAEMIVREGFLPVSSRVGDKLSAADPEMRSSLEALAKANFYPVQKPEWQAVMDNARKLGDAVLYDHLSPKAALDELQQFAISRSRP